MSIRNADFDQIDRKIAEALLRDASLTSSELGSLVGLSVSAANERLRRLKAQGIIKRIGAFLDSGFMNMSLGAYIFVSVEGRENSAQFLSKISAHLGVLECHHVTGEYSYILKVRCSDTRALELFISDFLKGQRGVTKTLTQIILSSIKEESLIVD